MLSLVIWKKKKKKRVTTKSVVLSWGLWRNSCISLVKLPGLLDPGRSWQFRTVLWIALRPSPCSSPMRLVTSPPEAFMGWAIWRLKNKKTKKAWDWSANYYLEILPPNDLISKAALLSLVEDMKVRSASANLCRVEVVCPIAHMTQCLCNAKNVQESSAVGMTEKLLLKVYLLSVGSGSLKLSAEIDPENSSGFNGKNK